MKTLKEIAIARKSRNGPAARITHDGAYWLAAEPLIASGGGDGVGQNSAHSKYYLDIRHYRSGDLRAYISCHSWHQNDGDTVERTRADDCLEAPTIEDLIACIMGHQISDYDDMRDHHIYRDELIKEFLEMAISLPAPDEQ